MNHRIIKNAFVIGGRTFGVAGEVVCGALNPVRRSRRCRREKRKRQYVEILDEDIGKQLSVNEYEQSGALIVLGAVVLGIYSPWRAIVLQHGLQGDLVYVVLGEFGVASRDKPFGGGVTGRDLQAGEVCASGIGPALGEEEREGGFGLGCELLLNGAGLGSEGH